MYKPLPPTPRPRKKNSQEKLPSCQATEIPSGRKAAHFPLGATAQLPRGSRSPLAWPWGKQRPGNPPAAKSTQLVRGSRLGGSLWQAQQRRGGCGEEGSPPGQPCPCPGAIRWVGGLWMSIAGRWVSHRWGRQSVLRQRKARRGQ